MVIHKSNNDNDNNTDTTELIFPDKNTIKKIISKRIEQIKKDFLQNNYINIQ